MGKNIICNVSHCVQLQTFDLTKKINETDIVISVIIPFTLTSLAQS